MITGSGVTNIFHIFASANKGFMVTGTCKTKIFHRLYKFFASATSGTMVTGTSVTNIFQRFLIFLRVLRCCIALSCWEIVVNDANSTKCCIFFLGCFWAAINDIKNGEFELNYC